MDTMSQDSYDEVEIDPEEWITLKISHRQNSCDFTFPPDATVSDLMHEIEETLEIPVGNQKLIVPKGPLLKWPPKEPEMQLQKWEGKTLKLMGAATSEVEAVQSMCEKVAKRNAARLAQRSKLVRRPKKTQSSESSQYTFMSVKPLPNLPRPERSQALLLRLKEDPGIKAAMKKHKFTVGLLTEMEPLSYTQSTHEGTSRTLGLNRNQGQIIELRLRTDAYDGYRDYKTIRKTLCHELAHNVHGPHDRNFWDLCHQIEREVDAADWKTGGQTIGETSRYTISGQIEYNEEDDHIDGGGWTGGEFVLGGSSKYGASSLSMSRREVLAQAALERQRKEDEAEGKCPEAVSKGWRPCQRPPSDKS